MRNKKFFALVLVLLTLLCAMPAVYADVLWEPYNNSFYDEVRDKCEYRNKAYIAQPGAEGYYDPIDEEPAWVCSETTTLYINFVYTFEDGTEWGCTDVQINETWESVWFDLSTLMPVYDHSNFLEDHTDEIAPYNGELDDFVIPGSMELWVYPGHYEHYTITEEEYFEPSWFELLYTDPNGDLWAYIPYIAACEGWVYIPDPARMEPIELNPLPAAEPIEEPAAASVAPTATQKPTATPANTPAPAAKAESTLSRTAILLIALAILAVLFVVILSVVLIVVIFVLAKKKKKVE